jgi:3-oxoadipate enol-lactonase
MRLALLPPLGLDARFWDGVDLPAATVHRHEYGGFGRRALGLPELADEVAATYPGTLDVVGLSMGGMVAQHLALRHPGKVRSLVLACTAAAVDPQVMLARAAAAERGGMAAVLDQTMARWFTPAALALDPLPAPVEYARSTLLALDPLSFARAWRAIAWHDLRARLGAVRVPVTCIAGTADASAPLAIMRDLCARISGAALAVLDGPHMLPLERPAEFADAVREHLDRVAEDASVA